MSTQLLDGPFPTRQALDAGKNAGWLQRHATRVFPHVYVPRGTELTWETRCSAALLCAPHGSAICAVAALKLRGLMLPRALERVNDIEIVVPDAQRWRAPQGLVARRTRHPWSFDSPYAWPVARHHVAPLVADVGTVWRLLALGPWEVAHLVMVGDRLVSRKRPWTDMSTLHRATKAAFNQPGRARLAQAFALARPTTDSVRETSLRLAIVGAGLPCPYVNIQVSDEDGELWAFLDLSYPDLKIAIEYDGVDHRRTDADRQRDNARQRRLRAAGWVVIVATSHDLARPARLISDIRAAIAARGSTPRAW